MKFTTVLIKIGDFV